MIITIKDELKTKNETLDKPHKDVPMSTSKPEKKDIVRKKDTKPKINNEEAKLFIARVDALTMNDVDNASKLASEYETMRPEIQNMISKETFVKLAKVLKAKTNVKKATRVKKEVRPSLNANDDIPEDYESSYGDVGPYIPNTDRYWEEEEESHKTR